VRLRESYQKLDLSVGACCAPVAGLDLRGVAVLASVLVLPLPLRRVPASSPNVLSCGLGMAVICCCACAAVWLEFGLEWENDFTFQAASRFTGHLQ
jgi:hypothetical protein